VKRFITILLATIVVVGGVILLKKNNTTAPGSPTNHTKGKGTSGVTLVQYGDFQCPGCGAFYPIVKQVTDHYKDEITFKFVNFPLTQIHLNALAAARAAEAASNQGKFWEMHDLLYGGQIDWSESSNATTIFEGYASQLKLDMARYRKDFASAETNAIINADIATGQKLKVTGTPTFFLDGKLIEDNQNIASAEKFQAVIDAAILAKTGKPSTSQSATTPATTNGTPAPGTTPSMTDTSSDGTTN
jgi:protein-disulfide isomerase